MPNGQQIGKAEITPSAVPLNMWEFTDPNTEPMEISTIENCNLKSKKNLEAVYAIVYPTWVTARTYAVGETVLRNGSIYVCVTAHTSGTFATDWFTSGNWKAIGDQPGDIKQWGGATAPAGWMLCNNTAVSRTTYADLFAILGTTFGAGDTTTTFNLPDIRGIFVRGAGTSAKLTNANGVAFTGTLGTYENDKSQGHRHQQKYNNNAASGATYPVGNNTGGGTLNNIFDPVTDGTNGAPRTGAETNPAALSLTYIIKW